MAKRFEEVVRMFQDFLEKHKCPREVKWIKPSDVIFPGKPYLYLRLPLPPAREEMAKRTYEAGMDKGMGVLFEMLCQTDGVSYCFVWSPKDADEAERMLMPADGGLKMSTRMQRPEVEVRAVRNRLLWRVLDFLPGRRKVDDGFLQIGA